MSTEQNSPTSTDVVWCAITEANVQAAAELCAATEAADDHGEAFGAQDILETLASPSVDPERGVFGAFTADGRAVALSLIFARTAADTVHTMFWWDVVHPDRRADGDDLRTQLIERSEAAAREISELRFPGVPAALKANVYDRLEWHQATLKSHGFSVLDYNFGMLRTFTEADAADEPKLPEGFTLVPFGPEVSEEFRATHNENFVPDHPGSTPFTREKWDDEMSDGSSSFRADYSFGLRDTASGTLAGYVLSRYYEADTASTGLRDIHLQYIGTHRAFRKRGVAGGLINTVCHLAAKQGFDTSTLGVRANNPTGALGVYQRAGYAVQRRYANYVREL